MNNSIHKNNKRIMLIEPPFYRLYHDQYCLVKYPLALGYLSGAIIKNSNWSVQTYNADFNVRKKVFNPENEYVSGEGFKRYLSSLKDYSLPIWKEVKNLIKDYNPSVVGILILGMIAFSVGTATGVLMAKLMNKLSSSPINPLIGAAGVSAVPMAARVVNQVGLEANSQNHLLMHAMGPNVSGVIGSAVAAGVLLAML